MKLRWTFLGLGAACAACCAPLILPLLGGAGLLGVGGAWLAWAPKLTIDQLLCVGLPLLALAVAAGVGIRQLARRRKAACGCATQCDVEACAPSTSDR